MESQRHTHKDGQLDWLVWLKWIVWSQWRAQDTYVAGLAASAGCRRGR